ncbi:hypothetical protein FOMPIDRAFT_92491 [Fomitopsis schrenkii]|uniref:Uncharacterized protein n=1 Tax=Fomitopsis schrenkii TaxID=2126942 RepID=S8FAD5_FOMSC|nr:hypothetical protein FOMPIDRAFT_92491 [Fomitopsis schrenkii]
MPNLLNLAMEKRSRIWLTPPPPNNDSLDVVFGRLHCRLQSLRWHITGSERGAVHLFRSPACGTVRDLVLALYILWHEASVIDLENASLLLRNIGDSLKSLTLLVRWSDDFVRGEGPLDLSHNTNLTSLDIRVWILEAAN